MGHKVLKPFNYSEDGINSRRTAVDEVLENVKPEIAQGLVDEGFISADITGEAASKVAGEAIVRTDLAGTVDSDKAVKEEAAVAKAGISDGKIGAPEAATIVDAHKLTDLSDPAVVEAAQAEKAAHEAGDQTFDPKSPEATAAAAASVEEKATAPKPHAKKK